MFRTKEPMRPTEPRRVLTYLYIYIYVFVFVFIHIIIWAYIYRERERWRQRERERPKEAESPGSQSTRARNWSVEHSPKTPCPASARFTWALGAGHRMSRGSTVVPFWDSYLESYNYKVIPKRNYFGAYGCLAVGWPIPRCRIG